MLKVRYYSGEGGLRLKLTGAGQVSAMCVMGHQPLYTTCGKRTAHLAIHARFHGIASDQGEICTAFGLLLE